MNDLKPEVQGKVAGLENGPHAHGKGLPAAIALVEARTGGFARKLPHGLPRVTVGANRAIRPKMRLNIRKGVRFGLELRGIEYRFGHGRDSFNARKHYLEG